MPEAAQRGLKLSGVVEAGETFFLELNLGAERVVDESPYFLWRGHPGGLLADESLENNVPNNSAGSQA